MPRPARWPTRVTSLRIPTVLHEALQEIQYTKFRTMGDVINGYILDGLKRDGIFIEQTEYLLTRKEEAKP